MRLVFLFSLALIARTLHAQYSDLLQNNKISWVAEYTTDYELNPAYNTKLETEANLLELQRLVNTQEKNGLLPDSDVNMPYYFSQKIYNGLKAAAFQCYADENLKEPLSQEQVLSRFFWKDSVSTEGFVAENEYGTEAFVTFRVRQVIFYNQPKRQFCVRILALAPIPWTTDADGYLIEHPPLLWIKLPELSKKQTRKLPKNANYVLQTRTQENSPMADQMHTIKGALDIREWATTEVQKPAHKTLTVDGFQALNPSALKALVYTADTLTTLNDQGQTVIDRIVQDNALDNVEKIRFVQDWYFDEQHLLFWCKIVAVAPVATINAAGGLFQFDKPLFYVKY
ncbi:MAG: hypothetical protein R3D58_04740 [Saprospiraceae bacterium]|nr:hypothetical protein [Lewinellaceae bacterium]